jgi:hypothetical protein
MPASRFMEWMVYDSIEPIGDRRGDIQAAIVAQTVFNMLKGSKQEALPLDKFLPKFATDPEAQPKRPQTVEEQMAIWQAITIAQNASLPNA